MNNIAAGQDGNLLGMQNYEKAPIYRCARDVLRETHVLVSRMPKQYKFTLGSILTKDTCDMVKAIFMAYEESEDKLRKHALIASIQNAVQPVLMNYRIALDLGIIPRGQDDKMGFFTVVSKLVHIIAQAKGWEAKARFSYE